MIKGVTMITSERPRSERGSTRRSTENPFSSSWISDIASVGQQHIALAAHRLQVSRKLRIGFDLAPETGHLHVYRSALPSRFGEVFPAERRSRGERQRSQQSCLGGGEANRNARAGQELPLDLEDAIAKTDGPRQGRGAWLQYAP